MNDGLFLAKHIKTEEAKLSFNRIIRKESVTEKELKELGFETLADANTFILKINSNAKGLRGLYLKLLESNDASKVSEKAFEIIYNNQKLAFQKNRYRDDCAYSYALNIALCQSLWILWYNDPSVTEDERLLWWSGCINLASILYFDCTG